MRNMKRMIGAILTVVMLAMAFSGTVIAAENVQSQYYSDVYSTDSWYDATNYLYEHDVLGGIIAPTDTQKGVFSPTSSLTRGQIVTILWRMLNEPNPDGSIVAFSDCSFGAYYYDAVRWASSSNVGIISGYEDNTFRPSRAITNQEMLTLLYKFACFCSYASNTASATNRFITAFNASSLTNKGTFSSYAKAA